MRHVLPTLRPPHADLAVLCHGGIREVIQLDAIPPRIAEPAAGPAGVDGAARGVDVLTESLLTLGAAGQVGLAGVEGDVSVVLDEFVDAGVVPSVTAPRFGGAAVQDPLDGEVDVVALALTCDFDAIGEGGDGAVGPAGSAVVGDVLVQMFGEVGFAVDVVPVEVVGNILLDQVPVLMKRER